MVLGVNGYSNQDIMAQEAQRRAALHAQQYGQAQQVQSGESAEESIMLSGKAQYSTAKGCTDGKDDGKIGFWGGLKSFGKGILNFGKSLIGYDEKGNWSLGRLAKNVAIGVGVAALCVATAGTAVPAIIAGMGVAGAAAGVAKSQYQFWTAKTDAEAKAAMEGTGSNTAALGLSLVGAKAAMKNTPGVDASKYTGFKGTVKAGWDSTMIGWKKAGSAVKNGYNAYKAGGMQAVKTTAVNSAKSSWQLVQSNVRNAVKLPTVAETQASRVKKYDSQIEQLRAQVEAATDKGVKNALNKKIARLTEQKNNIKQAFSEIDSETTFAGAQQKLNAVEQQIAAQKRQIETSTNTRANVRLKYEQAKLEQQADVYRSVIQQKTTQARNIRAEIDRIDKLPSELKTAEVYTKRAELVKQQSDLKFSLPDRAQYKTLSENTTKSTQELVKKQEAYTKAQKDVTEAETAFKKFEQGDPSDEAMLAKLKLDQAKVKADNAYSELADAQIANTSNNALQSAASGYDAFGTYTGKAGQFVETFNNQLGYSNVPFVAGKKVPFTNFTVPTKVSNSQMMLAANPWVNSSIGGPSIDYLLMREMGLTPEQIAQIQQGQSEAQVYGGQQAISPEAMAAYKEYMAAAEAELMARAQQAATQTQPTAQPTFPQTGQGPLTAQDVMYLDQIMKAYGITA